MRYLYTGPELSLIALRRMLGVWPMAYATVVLSDRGRVPAWPFALASFAVGGFALLPYLALRSWSQPLPSPPTRVERLATSRPFAGFLLVATWGRVGWAVSAGDVEVYRQQWSQSSLVYTMTADFAALTLAWWPVLLDDVRRRGGPTWAAVAGAIPVVGMPLWLTFRARPASA